MRGAAAEGKFSQDSPPTADTTNLRIGRCRTGIAPASVLCRLPHMATNLDIDDALLEEAVRVGGHRTKKQTVTEALEEYIQRRRQAQLLTLFGKIDFDPAYDYKKARQRK